MFFTLTYTKSIILTDLYLFVKLILAFYKNLKVEFS